MKKTVAIILLTIHAFNIAGYHFIFNYYKLKAGFQNDRNIDRGQYLASDLIEISIPYAVPYASSRLVSERFNGVIEVDGVAYNYVSLKLINDTMHLRCLPNQEVTRLNASGNEIAKQWTHTSGTEKKSDNSGSAKAFSDYNESLSSWTLQLTQHLQSNYNLNCPAHTAAGFHLDLEQPPRA